MMETATTNVCIYCRVSTSKQDFDHQLHALRKYAKKSGYNVVKEFTEKISGAKKIHDRIALVELLEFVKENKVDKILIFECSRLSRRASDFLNIIEELNEMGVSLYILQNGLDTLLLDGSINPIASLVCGIISQFNSMERTLIRSRMAAGYDNYRAKGGKVGRKHTYRKADYEYIKQYSKELDCLRRGLTLKDCRELTGTSINTCVKSETSSSDKNYEYKPNDSYETHLIIHAISEHTWDWEHVYPHNAAIQVYRSMPLPPLCLLRILLQKTLQMLISVNNSFHRKNRKECCYL